MNGIRRTLSFRKKKKKPECTEGSKPQQWLDDEAKIKEGCCSFHVRYLGNIEVYESRGMQVCEEAIRALRKSKKKPQKAILYVSGDALRVSDDVSQHLIVDQTIEKVSFCAPDRSHEKGFAYICRDGATRRWMCHAFLAIRESGERLSHAVGCAFAICLERKQKRERDALQLALSDDRPLVRAGSVRPATLAERLIDPQSALAPTTLASSGDAKSPMCSTGNGATSCSSLTTTVAGAIPRPRPSSSMLERQCSLRIFPKLQDTSPFKRDLSLRLNELPTNLRRLTNNMNGRTIPEERPSEVEESSPPAVPNASPITKPNRSGESEMALQAAEQASGCTAASPSLADSPISPSIASTSASLCPNPSLFNSAATFVDPFSAAPFDPTTIQQQLNQIHAMSNATELSALAHLSISSQPTISSYPGSMNHWVPGIPAPFDQVQCASPSVAPSPPVAGSMSVPTSAFPVTGSYPVYPSMRSPPPISPLSVVPHTVGTYSHFENTSWIPASTLASISWCPPLPSLLPPEPDRFADPFDVGWAERATACLATTTPSHKAGNPFLANPPLTLNSGHGAAAAAASVSGVVATSV